MLLGVIQLGRVLWVDGKGNCLMEHDDQHDIFVKLHIMRLDINIQRNHCLNSPKYHMQQINYY